MPTGQERVTELLPLEVVRAVAAAGVQPPPALKSTSAPTPGDVPSLRVAVAVTGTAPPETEPTWTATTSEGVGGGVVVAVGDGFVTGGSVVVVVVTGGRVVVGAW